MKKERIREKKKKREREGEESSGTELSVKETDGG